MPQRLDMKSPWQWRGNHTSSCTALFSSLCIQTIIFTYIFTPVPVLFRFFVLYWLLWYIYFHPSLSSLSSCTLLYDIVIWYALRYPTALYGGFSSGINVVFTYFGLSSSCFFTFTIEEPARLPEWVGVWCSGKEHLQARSKGLDNHWYYTIGGPPNETGGILSNSHATTMAE